MKSFILVCCAFLVSTGLVAQIDVESFEKISVNGNILLTIQKGEKETVDIHGNRDDVKIKLDQGKLKITRKDITKKYSDPPIDITVTYKYLRSLRASEGASVESDEIVESSSLELYFSTGATGNLEIEAGSAEVNVGEGAVLRLKGEARTLEAVATTGAALKAASLKGQRVYAKSNTGAALEVHAVESIEASASLGGSIIYEGDPGKVNISEKLGGSVSGW